MSKTLMQQFMEDEKYEAKEKIEKVVFEVLSDYELWKQEQEEVGVPTGKVE